MSAQPPRTPDARRAARRRQIMRRRARLAVGVLGLVVATLVGLNSGAPLATPKHPSGPRTRTTRRRAKAPAKLTARELLAAQQDASVKRVLRYTPYVQLAGHRRRDIALTFDDGPSEYTGGILHVLRTLRVHATFFVVGRWATVFPAMVAAEVRAGSEVGDHTELHAALGELSRSDQIAEIGQAAEAIERAGAPQPVLLRPPYGSFAASTLEILHKLGMLMVLWSVDTNDYLRPGTAAIVRAALLGARPGAIILMHDGGGDRTQTVAALASIIRHLRREHYRLVTVSQLLADDPPPADQPPPTQL